MGLLKRLCELKTVARFVLPGTNGPGMTMLPLFICRTELCAVNCKIGGRYLFRANFSYLVWAVILGSKFYCVIGPVVSTV